MLLRVAAVLLVITALLTCIIPGLHDLGEVNGQHLYFYQGKLVLCTSECFIEDGELMFYKSAWGTTGIVSISVVLIASVLAAVLWTLGAICKAIGNR